jgi:hypothetical protein
MLRRFATPEASAITPLPPAKQKGYWKMRIGQFKMLAEWIHFVDVM